MRIRIRKIHQGYGRKITLNTLIYTVLFFYIFCSLIVSQSLLGYRYDLSLLQYYISVSKIVLFIYFLYSNKQVGKKRLFELFLFLVIGFVTWWRVDSRFLDIFMLALTAKRDYKKTIDTFLNSLLCATVVIICADFIGIMPKYYAYRSDGMIRYTLGFSHSNILAMVIVALVFLLLLKDGGKHKVRNHILILCAALFCYKVPNSLTSTLILLVFELIIIMQDLYQHIFKKGVINSKLVRRIILILMPCIILFVYYIVLNLDKTFVFDVNSTIWSRISQSRTALDYYGFSIWGQNVNLVSSTSIFFGTVSSGTRFFALDCLYIYLPVRYGIVPSLYFVYQYIKCMYMYAKQKNMMALTICSCLIIYSIMETGVLNIILSFVFICAYSGNYRGDNKDK